MPEITAKRLLAEQRTIRKYTSQRPDPDVVRECIRIAQRSPSTSNHQPYCIIGIEAAELRRAVLAEMVCQPYVFDAPVLLLVCVDWSRQDQLAREVGMPSNAINAMSKLVVGVADASIFAHSLVLALQAHGLGVSYIASPYTALRKVAELLRIPATQAMPLHLLSLGHPAEDPPPRPRYPLDAIVHQDAFCAPDPGTVHEYFRSGSEALEREGYFEVTGDPVSSWREHYRIKFGALARQRTWEPLARDVETFFRPE